MNREDHAFMEKLENSISLFSSNEIAHFNEPYEILSVLKKTLNTSTLLARDQKTDKKVILKTLNRKHASSGFEFRLQEEAILNQTFRGDKHRDVLRTGITADSYYLVLPYVEGENLRERILRGIIPWEECLTLAIELLKALKSLHSHGIIHRDLKPENIIVNRETYPPEVNLIDFGSAWSSPFASADALPMAGTVLYLSPEQGGSTLDYEADERSDLYSLGVILFECLTNRTPFIGENIGDLIRGHLTSKPPDPRNFQSAIPRSFCEVVFHLLEKDPKNRYQTAEAAKEDLTLLKTHWEKERTDPGLLVGLTDKRSELSNPSFVGREKELQELAALLEQTRNGRGGMVFIEAESGEGKSRLAREFKNLFRENEVLFFTGQGVDQVAQFPFHLLSGAAEQALRLAQENTAFKDFLIKQLIDCKETLVSVLPSFHQLFPDLIESSMGPENFGEHRSLDALAALLIALGSYEKPALLVLDDCQWADEMTLKLFHYWQQVKPEKNHLLILSLYRSEEVGPSHSLRSLSPLKTLRLRPLLKDEISLLAQTMAGVLPSPVHDLIYTLSQGSPFMAAAVLRGLTETDTLVSVSRVWQYSPKSLQEVNSSERAATLLKRRFHILPEKILGILKLGAILGKEFSAKLVSAIHQVSEGEVTQALLQAEERHILWGSSDTGFVFVHDKLRETLLDLMNEQERKEEHRKVAEWYVTNAPESDFEISYHYDAAGTPKKAFSYAIRSAYSARKRYSLEIAEQQFRIAERGIEPGDVNTLRSVAESLGDVLMLRGKYEEAAQYLTLAKLTKKPGNIDLSAVEKATIDLKLGDLQFKRGDLQSASEALENGLSELNRSVPRNTSDLILRLSYQVAVQVFHTLFPVFLGRKSFKDKEEELLRMRIFSRLAYTYWFKRGRMACLWTHLTGLNLAERYPPTLELAQAYSEHAPIATLVAQFERGIRYALRSLKLRKKLEDLWGQGQSLSFYGVGLYCTSQFKETIKKCQEAVHILNRTGDRWEVNTAQWHIAYSYYRLGDLKKAQEISQHTYQNALRIGDIHAIGISLSAWAKASGGQVPEEFLKERLLSLDKEDIHTSAEVLQAEGIRLLALQRPFEAEAIFQEGCKLIQKKGMYSEYTVPCYVWLVTALRKQISKASLYEPQRKKYLLKKALKASRQALRLSTRFRNNLPHALREQAILNCYRGNGKKAHSLFKKSQKVAHEQEALCEELRTELMMAKFAPDFSWQVSRSAPEALENLRKLGANLTFEDETFVEKEKKSLSLLDRFDRLLEVGKEIATSASKDELYRALYEAFSTLFRSESCTLVEKDPNSVTVLFGEPKNISSTLLLETEEKREAVIFLGGQSLKVSESFLLTEIESAMCVPIFASGKLEFFIYLTHERVQNLFGPDERRIANYLSALAGAALENQHAVLALKQNTQKLMESNEELEQYAFLASHDLQEPIRNLQLTSQLLQTKLEAASDNETVRCLNTITESSRRMRTMITDLLSYAQLSSSQQKLMPLSSKALIEAAISNLSESLNDKKVEIFYGELPQVLGNKGQLVSVFQNLFSNSLKFYFQLPPRISITWEKEGDFAVFHVADNGLGFEPQQKEELFKLFKRLNPSELHPGTGIGLATCRKIIIRHGGKIWAEGSPFQGAKFHFTLPLAMT